METEGKNTRHPGRVQGRSERKAGGWGVGRQAEGPNTRSVRDREARPALCVPCANAPAWAQSLMLSVLPPTMFRRLYSPSFIVFLFSFNSQANQFSALLSQLFLWSHKDFLHVLDLLCNTHTGTVLCNKDNTLLIHTLWMNLKNIILSERN